MKNNLRDESLAAAAQGPLRHFRLGRRDVLRSLASGVGVGVGAAVFASQAAAGEHVHEAPAGNPAASAPNTTESVRAFCDPHAFDTLALLSEQIVPGSRDAQVAEFLDRLLAVESIDTQKRFTQTLGAFEREAREAHGQPWKSLSAEQASALLRKISTQPESEPIRQCFDDLKAAVAETYYSSEIGMKELGWNGSVAFAPPTSTCA